jgi:DUF2934 family protein
LYSVANGDECTLISAFEVKKKIPAKKEYPIMARSKVTSGSKRKEGGVVNHAVVVPPVAAEAVTEPLKGNGARDSSKREVMKTDPRGSVVPINLEDEIRRRAYELSQHRGFASGRETEDWLRAENEVLQRYSQPSG